MTTCLFRQCVDPPRTVVGAPAFGGCLAVLEGDALIALVFQTLARTTTPLIII
jgi:hypothetical protein